MAVIILLFIVVILSAVICSNWAKWKGTLRGMAGEHAVARSVSRCFRRGTNRFLNNLIIPNANGCSTEIDEVVISNSGIFVFEVKNFSGCIWGNCNSEHWKKSYPAVDGKPKVYEFYNPILQNASHIRRLRSVLKDRNGKLPMYSVIVFSNDCVFDGISYDGMDATIIHMSEIRKTLNFLRKETACALTDIEVLAIYEKLVHMKTITKKEHVENVKANAARKEMMVQNLICPRCGSQLVLRTSMKGSNAGSKFYGCSSYPKCRFTMNS